MSTVVSRPWRMYAATRRIFSARRRAHRRCCRAICPPFSGVGTEQLVHGAQRHAWRRGPKFGAVAEFFVVADDGAWSSSATTAFAASPIRISRCHRDHARTDPAQLLAKTNNGPVQTEPARTKSRAHGLVSKPGQNWQTQTMNRRKN